MEAFFLVIGAVIGFSFYHSINRIPPVDSGLGPDIAPASFDFMSVLIDLAAAAEQEGVRPGELELRMPFAAFAGISSLDPIGTHSTLKGDADGVSALMHGITIKGMYQ